jgi:hypothetical protein
MCKGCVSYTLWCMLMLLRIHVCATQCVNPQLVLEESIRAYKERHPNAEPAEVIKHVMKHDVPHTIPGSPSWHRHRLLDLVALVNKVGIPTIFLTLTADEVSETRWQEIDMLEALLSRYRLQKHLWTACWTQPCAAPSTTAKVCCVHPAHAWPCVRSWCDEFKWNDAPCENAFIIMRRCEKFCEQHLGFGSGGRKRGLLGRVIHNVTRYEVQGRHWGLQGQHCGFGDCCRSARQVQ